MMNAKVAEPIGVEQSPPARIRQDREFVWSVCAVCAFGGALLCFIAGLLSSLAALAGILPDSPRTARWTLAALLAALALAFAGAHVLDQLDTLRRERESS
jgi:hypothetical protein